jgi:hypothetical protein
VSIAARSYETRGQSILAVRTHNTRSLREPRALHIVGTHRGLKGTQRRGFYWGLSRVFSMQPLLLGTLTGLNSLVADAAALSIDVPNRTANVVALIVDASKNDTAATPNIEKRYASKLTRPSAPDRGRRVITGAVMPRELRAEISRYWRTPDMHRRSGNLDRLRGVTRAAVQRS